MAENSSPQNQLDEVAILIHTAEKDPDVPTIYANKLALSGNENDVSLVFKRGTEEDVVAVIYIPPGLSKVLSTALSLLLKQIESQVGYEYKIPGDLNLTRT